MSNTETFKKITDSELKEISLRWNFVPRAKYAGMVPVENEVGSLVDIPISSENVLRSGQVYGANIERLILSEN